MAKTKKIEGGPIARTNRIFIALREIGEIDENDKKVFAIGYKGRTVADPDRPLSTAMWQMIIQLANTIRYSTPKEREEDLRQFKKLIRSLSWVKQPTLPTSTPRKKK